MTTRDLSEWLANLYHEIQQTNSQFPRNLVPGWPIPFFGDVRHARVLTVGVNPSNQEFNTTRRWHEVTNPAQWEARLLGYFQNTEVRPWIWFETWSICLALLELSYAGGGAAHIDVSPRAATPMLSPTTDAGEFRGMVECDVKWFFDLLNKLPRVQLLLVAGPVPRANGTKQQLADFIREQADSHKAQWRDGELLPKLVTAAHPQGIPVFVCPFEPNVDGLYAMIRQVSRNRELLRRLSAPPKGMIPIVPARLDWPSAIGSFLLDFGILEYFVVLILKDHLAHDEFVKVKELHLKDRLTRIEQCLKDHKHSTAERRKFAELVERLGPLRELRNHIAHGHMYWRLDEKNQKQTVTLFKSKDADTGNLPNSKHVQFCDLENGLEELSKLIAEFETLAGFKPDVPVDVPTDLNK